MIAETHSNVGLAQIALLMRLSQGETIVEQLINQAQLNEMIDLSDVSKRYNFVRFIQDDGGFSYFGESKDGIHVNPISTVGKCKVFKTMAAAKKNFLNR